MKSQRLLSMLLISIALVSTSCGSDGDDPEAWVNMICEKMYDQCAMITEVQDRLGPDADACKEKMNPVMDKYNPNPAGHPGCEEVDLDACFDAWQEMSCDELKSNVHPEACQCK